MSARREVTEAELAEGFRGLGVEEGDILLVHSSLSALGFVQGGAPAVVTALLRTVGEGGTLVFPTLTGGPENGPDNPPVFDAARTPCWTGRIPETARQMPGFVRSLHPTHSVAARGPLAHWLTQGHEGCTEPCGMGSPYDRLASAGGHILLIGVDLSVNTSFHHAEELAGAPYVCQREPTVCTLTDAKGQPVQTAPCRLHWWGTERDYPAFEPEMQKRGMLVKGQAGEAQCRLIDAAAQRAFLLRRLLADPLCVLAPSARERWRGPSPA